MSDLDPYSTASPLLGSLPGWIGDPQEQRRIAAYALYESIYWGVPGAFKLTSRGAEDRPIYVPAGRQIVETLHRFMANDMKVVADPLFGDANQQTLAAQVWTDLARRERFYSKFSSNKRYGIMRGDWAWHLYANPEREPGSRISILTVDPASLFPIYNPDNIDELIGWHIAEQFIDNDGKPYLRRLTYRKQTGTGGPSPIDVTDELYELDDWGGPGMEQDAAPLRTLQPPHTLPSPIDQLPVYVVPNFDEPGFLWGSSEMRGLERLFGAINQTISDEDLTVSMDGLGVYATDAGTPVDDDGEDVPWNLGPARVLELPDGKKMVRVSGVGSVTPYQDHLKYLHDQIDQTLGMSSVAKGKTDVQTAESGIALLLELGPLLARAVEKELIVTDVHTNMFYDLAKWYVGYEGGAFNSLLEATRWVPVYGEKIPPNKSKQLDELLKVASHSPKIVSMQYVRNRMRALGFDDMPDETTMMAQILQETQIDSDITGARVDAEVDAELETLPQPED